MALVQLVSTVRARARAKAHDKLEAGRVEAELVGPFVILPPMDPRPTPPADDALLETDVPTVPSAVSGEGLRSLMAQFHARQL